MATPRFLLFFILSLHSLQVQLVWACTHIQCACVLCLQFRQLFLKRVSCVYLFVLNCSRLLESSAYNRMRKTMQWLRSCYCQMFHFTRVFDLYIRSLHPGLMSLSDGWVMFILAAERLFLSNSSLFSLSFLSLSWCIFESMALKEST